MKDCIDAGWHFPTEVRRPRVAHFCGRKPFLFYRDSYSRPFTLARLEHHRRRRDDVGAWLAVLNEECSVAAGKAGHRVSSWFQKRLGSEIR